MDGSISSSRFRSGFPTPMLSGHVNNSHYLSFLESARLDYLKKVLGCVKTADFGVIIRARRDRLQEPRVSLRDDARRLPRLRARGFQHHDGLPHRGQGDRPPGRSRQIGAGLLDYALNRPVRVSEERADQNGGFRCPHVKLWWSPPCAHPSADWAAAWHWFVPTTSPAARSPLCSSARPD